jgi:hypothetical protein
MIVVAVPIYSIIQSRIRYYSLRNPGHVNIYIRIYNGFMENSHRSLKLVQSEFIYRFTYDVASKNPEYGRGNPTCEVVNNVNQ